MKAKYIYTASLIMLFMFTTGIALPWLISNVVMPLWMIIFSIISLLLFWAIILEKPYRKIISYINKKNNKVVNNVD